MHNTDASTKNERRFLRKNGWLWVFTPGLFLLIYIGLFLNMHMKYIFEKNFSEMNGAQVDIGSVQISFIKGTVDISKVQFSHPAQPTKNLLEIDSVHAELNFEPIIRKKIIVNKMTLTGIHYYTMRDAEYAPPVEQESDPLSQPLFERFSSNLYTSIRTEINRNPLKQLAQFSTGLKTQTLVEGMEHSLESMKKIEEISRSVSEVEGALELSLQNKNSREDITTLLSHVSALPNKNRNIASETDLESISKKVAKSLAELSDLKEKARKKITTAEAGLREVDKLIEKDTVAVKETMGLPDSQISNLTPVMFGPGALFFLERISYWVDLARRRMPIRSGNLKHTYLLQQADYGQNIHFPYLAGNPSFLIKELVLDSTAEPATGRGDVKGVVSGITSDPYIYGNPLIANFTFSFPHTEIKNVHVQFEIEHMGEDPRETFRLHAEEVPFNNSPLLENPDLSVQIGRGKASISVEGTFEPDAIAVTWAAHGKDTEFKVASRYKRIEEFLKGLVSHFYQFDVKGVVKGPVDNLKLEADSEIGRTVALGLSDEFKRQLSAVDETTRNNILDHINPKKHAILERIDRIEKKGLEEVQLRLAEIRKMSDTLERNLGHIGRK